VPRDGAVPILPGWLHLSHVLNTHGSWLAGEFQPHSVAALVALQWGIVAAVLLFLVVGRRYYVRAQRRSLWTDAAFLAVVSADVSWARDIVLRGGILDFIGLPGLVTADLKDIFLTVGTVSFVAETLEHRRFWWQWKRGGSARGPGDPAHGAARTDRGGPRAD
jgi:lipoprotein signal peptidase